MIATAPSIEDLTLNLTLETHVKASLDATFAALRSRTSTEPSFESFMLSLLVRSFGGGGA